MAHQPVLDDLKRTFVPPPGLGASRPRAVQLTAGGRALFALAVVLFASAAGVGAAMHRTAVRQADERRAFAGDAAVLTEGRVVRLWRETDGERQRWMSYGFDVDGQTYEVRTKVGSSRWNRLQVGSALPIRYLRSDPRRSVVAGMEPGGMPRWLPFLVGVAIAALGLACLAGLQAQRHLLMDGRVAPALVTAHTKHTSSHGGTDRSIVYGFRLLSGATAVGKSGAPSKPPAIGTIICVLYDPDRPRRSRPYPFSLVRPARA